MTNRNLIGLGGDRLVMLPIQHEKIQEGKHFFFIHSLAISNTVTRDFLLVTPAAPVSNHFIFLIEAGTGTFTIFEDTVTSALGALQTTFNHNRNSANVAGMLVYLNPTVTSPGTALALVEHVTAAQSVAPISATRPDHELILKPSSQYMLRFLAGMNTTLTNHWDWYEDEVGL